MKFGSNNKQLAQEQPGEIQYRIETTPFWEIKSYVYQSTGMSFYEYTSHRRIGALPLVHITLGRDPATGRRKTARGVIAIGRIAMGVLPIGQLAIGVLPIGQLAIGLLFALGQGALALTALGQFSIGPLVAIGQFAVGAIAVGQMGAGYYFLGQMGIGVHIYTSSWQDTAAAEFFGKVFPWLLSR